MKLIADSGSTKTDWRLISPDGQVSALTSKGINPYHRSENEIDDTLASLEFTGKKDKVGQVFFYGAGITGNDAEYILQSALHRRFGFQCEVFVGDDLLAAGRALFKEGKGIACILGTGSNSCLYDNGIIREKIPALGYILGDEGSGTDMGKRFINALFKRALPGKLADEILKNEEIEMHTVLKNVYREEYPARHLASYSRIIRKYINHESIKSIVEEAFDNFFRKNIVKYKNYASYEIGFAGSIAYHFKDILEETSKKWDLEKITVLSSPIDELVNYHKK
ncbi:MAG: ATPase [Bacteroidales bacterium]